MRPMMRLVLGLGALVLILAGVAVALPSNVNVARSVVINAPEYIVFPYLNNMKRFNSWSPWAARDPQLQATFSGPEEGKGAKIEWTSSAGSVGDGSIAITESQPNNHIDLAMTVNGLEGEGSYDVAPAGSGSKVTWGFGYETGSSPFRRWKGLMLDRFIGAEYQTGLARLKERIETDRKPAAPSAAAVPVAPPMIPGDPSAMPAPTPIPAPAAGAPPAAPAPAPAAAQVAPPPAPPAAGQSTAPKKRQQ